MSASLVLHSILTFLPHFLFLSAWRTIISSLGPIRANMSGKKGHIDVSDTWVTHYLIWTFWFVSENTWETMPERRKRCWNLEEGSLDSFGVSCCVDSHSIVGWACGGTRCRACYFVLRYRVLTDRIRPWCSSILYQNVASVLEVL
jgi:hypothetical protein